MSVKMSRRLDRKMKNMTIDPYFYTYRNNFTNIFRIFNQNFATNKV